MYLLSSYHFPGILETPSLKIIKDCRKPDYVAINDELSTYSPLYAAHVSSRSVEQNWLLFKNNLNNLVILFAPTVHVRDNLSNLWHIKALRSLNSKKKRLFRKETAAMRSV